MGLHLAERVRALAYRSTLYFGRDIPSGGYVHSDDWRGFLSDVVSHEFPQGYAWRHGFGAWQSERDGMTIHEDSYILEIVHEIRNDTRLDTIALIYKERFGQEAVMLTTEVVDVWRFL